MQIIHIQSLLGKYSYWGLFCVAAFYISMCHSALRKSSQNISPAKKIIYPKQTLHFTPYISEVSRHKVWGKQSAELRGTKVCLLFQHFSLIRSFKLAELSSAVLVSLEGDGNTHDHIFFRLWIYYWTKDNWIDFSTDKKQEWNLR